MAKDLEINDFIKLGDPVENKIFFSGEATTPYFSHLHSAFISGERDANRIIKLIENNKKI
jgi:hypothetical protein